MNVVDSLVVTLGLDTAGFKKGGELARVDLKKTSDAATRAAKDMQADGAKAAEFFAAIKVEALSLIGVLVGGKGIETFARDATKSMADLGRSAQNIGLAAPQLAAFQNMIERNGGSADAATASLKGYADQIERFRVLGDATVLQYLNPIGASVNDNPLDVYMKFQKFVEEHKGQPGGAQLINLEGAGLGYDQGLINAAIQIESVVKANQQLAQSYRQGVPSQEQIDRVTKMQGAFYGLGQSAEYVGEKMLAAHAGGLTAFADWMNDEIVHEPAVVAGLAVITGYLTVIAGLNFATLMAVFGRLSIVLGMMPLAEKLIEEGRKATGDDKIPYDADHPYGEAGGLPQIPGGAKQWWQENMPSWLGGGSSVGPTLAPDIEAEVRRQAAAHGLDPDHMARLAQKEGGGYDKVSPAGAFGPMQLMPGTAASVGVKRGGPWQDNVRGGIEYYKQLLAQFGGNYAAADAAYNAGPNNPGVKQFYMTGDQNGLPKETKDYINSLDNGGRPIARAAPSNTNSLSVGQIHIYTQATDAKGIARDIRGALIEQANRGLQ